MTRCFGKNVTVNVPVLPQDPSGPPYKKSQLRNRLAHSFCAPKPCRKTGARILTPHREPIGESVKRSLVLNGQNADSVALAAKSHRQRRQVVVREQQTLLGIACQYPALLVWWVGVWYNRAIVINWIATPVSNSAPSNAVTMIDPSTSQTASPLLATKLHRPRASAALVPRPRLLGELTAGLSQRLTLVSAPAGYGKTTLVNQWMDTIDHPSAWISLDEHDGDLATFLSYFVAAVRSVYPDAGRSTETLLRAPTLPSPDRLADSLLHDLVALPGPLILVLDDYHMIQTVDVQVVVARLVQHMPAHVHLVLTTRADPPLPLERLRGRQQLVELRSADLRFTLEEASQLLRQLLGPAAADETATL